MSLHPRTAILSVVVLALGLVSLSACKKSKPTESDSSNPNPPPPDGGLTNDGRDPLAPKSPIFRGGDVRLAGARDDSKKNLHQIGLGLHNYADANGTLPGGYLDKDGKPGLSWRVAI